MNKLNHQFSALENMYD